MAPGSPRAVLNGSALVALLSKWSLPEASAAPPSFADGLGRWLGWTEAGPLFNALNTAPAQRAGRPLAPAEVARELARVRGVLGRLIDDEPLLRPAPAGRGMAPPRGGAPEVGLYRQRYGALQQSFELALEPLRPHWRGALVARGPQAARLAALDAVMEQVLAGRERSLMSMLPLLLERRFERLQRAHDETLPAAEPAGASPTPARPSPVEPPWLAGFRLDMQQLLRAELAHRLQPLEGLAAALGVTNQDADEQVLA